VLVTPADPAKDLLVPMVARLRPDVDPDQVRELHRRLTLGRISPEEFWQGVDLSEERDEIETRYLSSFRLVPGLHTFLGRMASSRLPVSAVGNQPRAWGDRLRRMASLEGVLSSWLVSGEVGARLPDPGLFEATRRTMSVDLYDCFYLSNRPEHLDAAQELGLATGLFIPEGDVPDGTEHLVVRGFDDLLRNRGS
jgi:FMN phosphatase YigB (HAD superfamily)